MPGNNIAVNLLRSRLTSTPQSPGVYIMRDKNTQVLYIGKAVNLRQRLRWYFNSDTDFQPKIKKLVQRISDFEYILTDSEQEALILECNLIKIHKPIYNARLKDDKSYPFIKIDTSEEFPQVYITRRPMNDGSLYFGPFASAYSVRRTLTLLKKLFPYRSCTKIITGTDPKPCLDYHIHRCVGPCIGAVDKHQYAEVINQVIMFLQGKTGPIVKSLTRKMNQSAKRLDFEQAIIIKEQLESISSLHESQKVTKFTSSDVDVIATAPFVGESWVEIFFIREGKLVGRDNFAIVGTQEDYPTEILSAFVKQYYDSSPYIPPSILLQHNINDLDAIRSWLSEKRGTSVKIEVPKRGEKHKMVQMVFDNAVESLNQFKLIKNANLDMQSAIAELQNSLDLQTPPNRIECYDISNIQGNSPVGSMIVFENGKPKKSDYRKFNIKTVDGIDDYAMMREVLTRRFTRLLASSNDKNKDLNTYSDKVWTTYPDLVLIDGGKGHLNTAIQVFLELGIQSIPLASIAKQNEELFIPHVPEPVVLSRDSKALFLVQQSRDEAHKFAINFHRNKRSKYALKSVMDSIPGIGPKKRSLLLSHFGSVNHIKTASIDRLTKVAGINPKLARTVKRHLN